MIEIEDMCKLALSLDKGIKELGKEKDEISNVSVTMEVPKLELLDLDKKLYMLENETDAGYVSGDKVECTMLGIRFCVLPKALD